MCIFIQDRYVFLKKCKRNKTKNSTVFNELFLILDNLDEKVECNNYQHLDPSSTNNWSYPNNMEKVYFTAFACNKWFILIEFI